MSNGFEQQPQASVPPQELGGTHTPEDLARIEALRKEIQQKLGTVAVVDVTPIAESYAQSAAEERMQDSPEKKSGFFKKIWKHNIAEGYYRQKYLSEERQAIYDAKNLYKKPENLDAHTETLEAITRRFISEYNLLRDGEEKHSLSSENKEVAEARAHIERIVVAFAENRISENVFNTEAARIEQKIAHLGEAYISEGKLYANNLQELAQELRSAKEHGVGLDTLDIAFNIVIGRAIPGIHTESKKTFTDAVVEKLTKSSIGAVVNETTLAAAVAMAHNAITTGLTTSAKLAGGTIFVSGLIAGMKEGYRLRDERAAHMRDMASGKEMTHPSARREMLEQFRYDTVSARKATEKLESFLHIDENEIYTAKEFEHALAVVVDIEKRISLSIEKSIDLISYSHPHVIEQERTELEITLAKVKKQLQQALEQNPKLIEQRESFDERLTRLVALDTKSYTLNTINSYDRSFNKMKRSGVVKAFVKGSISSVIIGGVVNEVIGHGKELLNKEMPDVERTPLQQIRAYFQGEKIEGSHVAPGWDRPGESIRLPENMDIHENADKTVTLIRDGKVVLDHAPFALDEQGNVYEETKETLASRGISIEMSEKELIEQTVPSTISPEEYVSGNEDMIHIEHGDWVHPEQAVTYSVNNVMSIAEHSYVISLDKMALENPILADKIKELSTSGNMSLLISLSEETQDAVFNIPFNEDGNVTIDKESAVGKLCFVEKEEQVEFLGKYADIGVFQENNKIEVLGSSEGGGIIGVNVEKKIAEEHTIYDLAYNPVQEMETIHPIPAYGRKPLEKSAYTVLEKKVRVSNAPDVPKESRPQVPPQEVSEEPQILEPAKTPEDQSQSEVPATQPEETITTIPFEEIPQKTQKEIEAELLRQPEIAKPFEVYDVKYEVVLVDNATQLRKLPPEKANNAVYTYNPDNGNFMPYKEMFMAIREIDRAEKHTKENSFIQEAMKGKFESALTQEEWNNVSFDDLEIVPAIVSEDMKVLRKGIIRMKK